MASRWLRWLTVSGYNRVVNSAKQSELKSRRQLPAAASGACAGACERDLRVRDPGSARAARARNRSRRGAVRCTAHRRKTGANRPSGWPVSRAHRRCPGLRNQDDAPPVACESHAGLALAYPEFVKLIVMAHLMMATMNSIGFLVPPPGSRKMPDHSSGPRAVRAGPRRP